MQLIWEVIDKWFSKMVGLGGIQSMDVDLDSWSWLSQWEDSYKYPQCILLDERLKVIWREQGMRIEPVHEISNNFVCAYAQSDQSLC